MVCGVHLGLLTGVLEEIGTRTRVSLVPALDGRGPCLVRLGETSVPAADPVSPHRSRSECYERAEAGPGADTGDHPERSAGLMLALATVGFAMNFWAWALLSPLAPKLKD